MHKRHIAAASSVYVYFELDIHPSIHGATTIAHCRPSGRSSIVHQIGLDVVIVTTFSSGTRWFDVDTRPPKDDSASASGNTASASSHFSCSANVRTQVPAQAGRGENRRVDADGKQPAGRAEDGVVDVYLVGPLRWCRRMLSRRATNKGEAHFVKNPGEVVVGDGVDAAAPSA